MWMDGQIIANKTTGKLVVFLGIVDSKGTNTPRLTVYDGERTVSIDKNDYEEVVVPELLNRPAFLVCGSNGTFEMRLALEIAKTLSLSTEYSWDRNMKAMVLCSLEPVFS